MTNQINFQAGEANPADIVRAKKRSKASGADGMGQGLVNFFPVDIRQGEGKKSDGQR